MHDIDQESDGSLDELIAAAELGEEARQFLASDLGRLILGLADQEVELAKEELLKVDPTDIAAVQRIQAKAALAGKFKGWLVGILQDGEQSLIAFKQQQEG